MPDALTRDRRARERRDLRGHRQMCDQAARGFGSRRRRARRGWESRPSGVSRRPAGWWWSTKDSRPTRRPVHRRFLAPTLRSGQTANPRAPGCERCSERYPDWRQTEHDDERDRHDTDGARRRFADESGSRVDGHAERDAFSDEVLVSVRGCSRGPMSRVRRGPGGPRGRPSGAGAGNSSRPPSHCRAQWVTRANSSTAAWLAGSVIRDRRSASARRRVGRGEPRGPRTSKPSGVFSSPGAGTGPVR